MDPLDWLKRELSSVLYQPARAFLRFNAISSGVGGVSVVVRHELSVNHEWSQVRTGSAPKGDGAYVCNVDMSVEEVQDKLVKYVSSNPLVLVNDIFPEGTSRGCLQDGTYVAREFHRHLIHDMSCESCNGRGQYTCENCSGKGKHMCHSCHGRYTAYDTKMCSFCIGSGRSDMSSGTYQGQCTHCSGAGRVSDVCSTCWGEGYNRCLSCFGSGLSKCARCDATGCLHQVCRYTAVSAVKTQLTCHETESIQNLRSACTDDEICRLVLSGGSMAYATNGPSVIFKGRSPELPFSYFRVIFLRSREEVLVRVSGCGTEYVLGEKLLAAAWQESALYMTDNSPSLMQLAIPFKGRCVNTNVFLRNVATYAPRITGWTTKQTGALETLNRTVRAIKLLTVYRAHIESALLLLPICAILGAVRPVYRLMNANPWAWVLVLPILGYVQIVLSIRLIPLEQSDWPYDEGLLKHCIFLLVATALLGLWMFYYTHDLIMAMAQ